MGRKYQHTAKERCEITAFKERGKSNREKTTLIGSYNFVNNFYL